VFLNATVIEIRFTAYRTAAWEWNSNLSSRQWINQIAYKQDRHTYEHV